MNDSKQRAEKQALDARLEAIALEHTGVPQLTARNSDRLDFHDVGCIGLRRALEAAYALGLRDARISQHNNEQAEWSVNT